MPRCVWLAVWVVVAILLVAHPVAAGVHRWTSTGPEGGHATIVRFDPNDPTVVYAVVAETIYRSTDSGATWARRDTDLPVPRAGSGVTQLAIDPGDSSNLLAITQDRLFRSTDAGATWVPSDAGITFVGQSSLIATHPAQPGTFYIAGQASGQIRRTLDAGATWAPFGVAPSAGAFPTVYAFVLDPNTPTTLYELLFDTALQRTRLFKSTNAAASWTAVGAGLPSGPSMVGLAVAPTNPTTLYLTVAGDGLFRSTDAGLTWSQAGLGRVDLQIHAVDPADPATLYAKTSSSYPPDRDLFRSTDDGATWIALDTHVPALETPPLTSVAVDPSDPARLIAASPHGIVRSTDAGGTWALANGGFSRAWGFVNPVLAPDGSTLYVISSSTVVSYVLWKSPDAGATWAHVNPEPTYVPVGSQTERLRLAMDRAAPSTLYLGSNRRGVFKSVDGAATWTPASGGLGSLQVNAVAVDPFTPTVVYAATASGVFRSVDGAGSWSLHASITTLTELAVDPVTPGRLYANDGDLTSVDGGASFAPSGFADPAFPTVLALDPTTPLTAYLGIGMFDPQGPPFFYYSFAKSVDGLASVVATDSGLVSALAIDPSDPATVWAAYSSRFPRRSRDAGDTFSDMGAGLPYPLGSDPNAGGTSGIVVAGDGETVFLAHTGLGVHRLDLPPCAVDGECDDANPCTSDACVATRCEHADLPGGTACAGSNVCPFTGTCSAGTCRPSASLCDDGNSCLRDTCLTSGVCEHFLICGGGPTTTSTTSTTGPTTTTTTTLDLDGDDDGVTDATDNCPAVVNPTQANLDGDALGDACDPDDGPLALDSVKMRGGIAAGRANAKARIVPVGIGDVFDAAPGVAVTITDGLTAHVSFGWPSVQCSTRGRSTRCRSADGRKQARFTRDAAGTIRVRLRLNDLTLPSIFAAPVRLTITQVGAAIDRTGLQASCTTGPYKLTCRSS